MLRYLGRSETVRAHSLLWLLLLLGSSPARAQATETSTSLPPVGGIVVKMALEPHLVVSLGYLGPVGLQRERSRLAIGPSIMLSPYLLARRSARLNLVAAGDWLSSSGWGVSAVTEVYVARARNRAGTIHGFGVESRWSPGYFGRSWGVAADLGWQTTLVTHVRHAAAAHEAFEGRYADDTEIGAGPVDGWYGSTAHRVRLGLRASRGLSGGGTLGMAVGSRFALQRQGILLGFAHGQVPVYLEASFGFGH